MNPPVVTVVYHSAKMLLTLDWNMAVEIFAKTYGQEFCLKLRPMTPEEKAEAEDQTCPVTAVLTRFMLFDVGEGQERRRQDIEMRILEEGRK